MTALTGAIVVPQGGSAQPLIEAFAAALKAEGLRVGGLVQRSFRDANGDMTGMELVALDSGENLSIDQQLGKEAACSVDPQAMSAASAAVRRAVAGRFDLVVVNKFSHLEAEGGGLSDEAMLVMSEELPLLIAVGAKYLDRWMAFCGGLCELLEPDEAAVRQWWAGVLQARA